MKKTILAAALMLTVGFGATAVSQVNVDGDDDQYNGAYFVGAANTASVAAVGIQGNLLVGKATQSVGAFGAQTSVGQVNKDSDDDQKNNAMFVGTLNTGDVAAAGTQVNVLTGKASQDVNASGAGTFIAQKNAANYGEDDQTNNVSFAGTLNTGAVAASGTQINGAVFRATQSVSAIGAGVSVDQINANTDSSQRNVASGILSVNVGPTAAAGTQLNLGVAKASQSIGSVGSSANISQANRYND